MTVYSVQLSLFFISLCNFSVHKHLFNYLVWASKSKEDKDTLLVIKMPLLGWNVQWNKMFTTFQHVYLSSRSNAMIEKTTWLVMGTNYRTNSISTMTGEGVATHNILWSSVDNYQRQYNFKVEIKYM